MQAVSGQVLNAVVRNVVQGCLVHSPLPWQMARTSTMSPWEFKIRLPAWEEEEEEKGRWCFQPSKTWCLKPSKTCIKKMVESYSPCFISIVMFLFLFTYRSISYRVDAHAAVPFLCIPVHFILMRLAIRSPKCLAAVVLLQCLTVTGFVTWILDGMAYLERQRCMAAFFAAAEGLQGPVPAAPGTDEALFRQMHADNPSSNIFLPIFMILLPPWMLSCFLYAISRFDSGFSSISWKLIGIGIASLVLNLLVLGTGLALSQNDYNTTHWVIIFGATCAFGCICTFKFVLLVHDVQRHAEELSSQKASQEHADSVLNHVLKNIMVWACAVCQQQESPAPKEIGPSCGSIVEVFTYPGT